MQDFGQDGQNGRIAGRQSDILGKDMITEVAFNLICIKVGSSHKHGLA